MRKSAFAFLAALSGVSAVSAEERRRPPMVDPAIDVGGEPFCYFSRPTDQLGVMDGEHGFQVTAEGWLYTRRAEVVFMAGPDLAPVCQRIRTLRDGRLPVLEYAVTRNGVRYGWTMFAATLDGDPLSPLFAFVRVEAENTSAQSQQAATGVAVRHYNAPRSTARVPADEAYPFRWRSLYAIEDGVVTRDERALLFLPVSAGGRLGATLESPYEGPFRGADHGVVESTPVCPVIWEFPLNPGESRAFDIVVPLVPVPPSEIAAAKQRVGGAFDTYLEDTIERWRTLFDAAIDLRIPEQKAHDTFWTSAANVAIARDQVAPDVWIQRVNELQYHTGFWPRDASYFMMAWWYLGLPEEGRRVVDHYFRIQDPDGSFQHDPENISPFAVARWFRLTDDLDYAEKAFPYLWRNSRWLAEEREADPLHLMPRRGRYDNEGIDGHYTGHNFYNLCALREAAAMARALGRDEESAVLEAEHREYRATFLGLLEPLVEQYGQIPPGMDTGIEGANWGNLTGSYPTEVLTPDHPWIAATSDTLRREKYEEGLLIFDGFGWWSLHHYSTIKNTYSDLLRGRDDLVVKDLYALLAHTSASNAGFEFCLVGWSNRDFGGNFSPHGWFAAKLIGLVRLMLVREEGDDLHLLSALPPAWVAPGRTLTARRMLTKFGTADLETAGTDSGCTIRLRLPEVRRAYLHVPWYAENVRATVDGASAEIVDRRLRVPPGAREIVLSFVRGPDASLDYEGAVRRLRAEYRERYAAWRARHPEAKPFDPFPEKRFPTVADGAERARDLAALEGIAAGQPVRASSAAVGHPAVNAADGVGGTNTPFWSPEEGDASPWWEVAFEANRTIGRVRVQCAEGSAPLRFRGEVSADGAQWTSIADRLENDLPGRDGAYDLFFPTGAASRLRLMFPPDADVRLAEVHVFSEAPEWQDARDVLADEAGNLARGRLTLSSAWEGENGPWKAVDGRASWGEGFWAGAVGHPQWWVVDLEAPREIGRARLHFYAGDPRGYAWVLESSLDGVRWRRLAEHRTPLRAVDEGTEVSFAAHEARFLRVVVLENTDNPAAHIAEVEVYGE